MLMPGSLLVLLNKPLDVFFDVIDFSKKNIFRRKFLILELESGIVVKLEGSPAGEFRKITLTRNQAKFQRISPADTLYSISYSSRDDWQEIMRSFGDGSPLLPIGYSWDSGSRRLIKMLDGEIFSISEKDVLKIDDIIKSEFLTKGEHWRR